MKTVKQLRCCPKLSSPLLLPHNMSCTHTPDAGISGEVKGNKGISGNATDQA
ncbi:hypothetical protein HMPREF1981_02101 [Bacteroides pyogenes F0041]|uniref:Uncharacterized protein n=1 Tax=Bacteroides pyogenes F0041 TaxID=1321819 RepID=U2C328_9BACE|nr:hypothetical protein HMPREF1981_02101 [Bacteroides pyogenes F0041]